MLDNKRITSTHVENTKLAQKLGTTPQNHLYACREYRKIIFINQYPNLF